MNKGRQTIIEYVFPLLFVICSLFFVTRNTASKVP
jgi:hypothetical protein